MQALTHFSDTPGYTHVLSHVTDMGENPPVKPKYYRYDKKKTESFEWHIQNMLKEGIIENINSPFCSTGVLCRKKNGKPADNPEASNVTIDYSKLNKITRFHNHPMPRIEDWHER